jgi:hypothetical protein
MLDTWTRTPHKRERKIDSVPRNARGPTVAVLASAMHASKSMSIQPWPTEEKCNCVHVPSQLRLCFIELERAEWETGVYSSFLERKYRVYSQICPCVCDYRK